LCKSASIGGRKLGCENGSPIVIGLMMEGIRDY
jgi:hypothetical protein